MKALQKIPNDTMKIVEVNVPTGQVLLEVMLAGICRTDVYVGRGIIPVAAPLTLGHEFVGKVIKDNTNTFMPGKLVAVNPLMVDGSFLGLNIDGCFAEKISVPVKCCYLLPDDINLKLASYLEPISASLAPLKVLKQHSFTKVGIYGHNRIGHLTKLVLEQFGHQCVLFEGVEDNSFDVIIETISTSESIKNIFSSLKNNGTLICKSRNPKLTETNLYEIVKKELTVSGAYYYDWNETIQFALAHEQLFSPLFGEIFSLDDYEQAFLASEQDKLKIFISVKG